MATGSGSDAKLPALLATLYIAIIALRCIKITLLFGDRLIFVDQFVGHCGGNPVEQMRKSDRAEYLQLAGTPHDHVAARMLGRVEYGPRLGLFNVDSKDGLLGLVRSDDNMMKAPTDRLGDQFYRYIDRNTDEKKAMERLVLPSRLAGGA